MPHFKSVTGFASPFAPEWILSIRVRSESSIEEVLGVETRPDAQGLLLLLLSNRQGMVPGFKCGVKD